MTDPPAAEEPTVEDAARQSLAREESALVRRTLAGDTEAFDVLVRRYLRKAYAVAYRVLGHREDAEDAVQEAFVTALHRLETFEDGRPFAPWLCRIVLTRSLNARASRSRRATDDLTETTEGAASADAAAPDRELERAEVRERFREALAALPERTRMVVEMVDGEGFSGVEAASALGMAAATARWHLHQGRQLLRAALAPLRGSARDDRRTS